ncbi:hypothetical protein J1N35_025013 [Gossypium stocksii]|uniref:Uncharacterized protein n=1 Tax=Gossypium stocksii TaxID=47602 RepID=A0A9D3V5S6_9ROSI|nr:hypothetical protein J1N35_025013 [Gossypium stocksii]
MEGNKSYGNGSSWADQWDYCDPAAATSTANEKKSSSGGATAKYKPKVGDGLEKTKSVASTGIKKVKQGTSSGLQWIKDKYHKSQRQFWAAKELSLWGRSRFGLEVNVKARKPARSEVRYGDLGIGTPMNREISKVELPSYHSHDCCLNLGSQSASSVCSSCPF